MTLSTRQASGSGSVSPASGAAPPTPSSWLRHAVWVWLAIGLATALLTYRDYGPTWDEGFQAHYGELCVRYFESGGQDKSCNEFLDLRYYGPLLEMIPALVYDAEDASRFEIRHLFFGLLALLAIPAVWLFARRLGGVSAAFFAVPAVVTLPRFYGHWFHNTKDVPFAISVIWLMVAVAVAFGGDRVRWRGVVYCGIALGLGLCTRAGGMPLFLLFVGTGAGVWLLSRPPSAGGGIVREALRLVPVPIVVLVIAWPIMVAPWPWAHDGLVRNPVRAMQVATEFPTTVPVLFEGVRINSSRLPWYYVAKYILIGTPLSLLALAGLGLAVGIRTQRTDWRSTGARLITLTQVWLFAPLVLYAVMRPNVYGGMRHFMFVLPALGIFAGQGAAAIVRAVGPSRLRGVAGAAMLLVVLSPLLDLIRLHPYQMTYHNAVVGGLPGASKGYWTDYWVSSYREAIDWVNQEVAATPDRKTVVILAAGPSVMMWARQLVAPNVELIPLTEARTAGRSLGAGEFYIATTRNRPIRPSRRFTDAPVVHTVGRDGVPFTVIQKGR